MSSRKSSGRPRKTTKRRTWRQKIELDGAVIVGPQDLGEIVYCYTFPSRPGRVKIGYSSRGLARVAEQSTAFPEKPKVIFVIHDRRARAMEEAFHLALADRQADVPGTEWFDADWRDLLRVSPILRGATGWGKLRSGVRIGLSFALASSALILTPAFSAGVTAVVSGVPIGDVFADIALYPAAILDGDLSRAGGLASSLWGFAFAQNVSIAWPLSGLATVPLGAALPWLIRRRQAF